MEWMRSIVENVTGVVAIDGKQARRTKDGRKSPLHVVSAFSAECSLVLGQLACEEKSNEITAIPSAPSSQKTDFGLERDFRRARQRSQAG